MPHSFGNQPVEVFGQTRDVFGTVGQCPLLIHRHCLRGEHWIPDAVDQAVCGAKSRQRTD
ncbi:MAG TPA: hypothetical protein DGG94_02995 [Micromonosporaceae bacterium]|nr:hypothetical protein [Micromonosporaceae bacterium]HCU48784.1 hypothetical protein [Micromonosporaceae bacterium]